MSTTQFFKNVPYVKYEGPKTRNPFAFRYYNPDEIVEGKTMKEYLNLLKSQKVVFAKLSLIKMKITMGPDFFVEFLILKMKNLI